MIRMKMLGNNQSRWSYENEEKVLIIGLDGYKEYTERVKYRLFPYIW